MYRLCYIIHGYRLERNYEENYYYEKENSIPVRNSLLLLLTATIWGVAFVAQSVSMDYIGGFTFNAVRNLIGALTLLPVIKVLDKTRSEAEKKCESSASGRKTLLIGGICCGIMLCLAGNFSAVLVLNTQPLEKPVLLLHVTSSLFRSSVFSLKRNAAPLSGLQSCFLCADFISCV